jgi:hypothetical protein
VASSTTTRPVTEPADDESKRLGRGGVEPLRVIDQREHRSLVPDLCKQAQGGHVRGEAICRALAAQTQRTGQRPALRHDQTLDLAEHRPQQLRQTRVRKL